jgi:chorismate mutase
MGTQVQGGLEVLQKRRKEIDLLDAELLRLLNERAQIVLELAAVKKSSGLPAYDGQREQEVLERMCRENQGPLQAESVVTVFRAIIHEFRRIGEAAMRQLK